MFSHVFKKDKESSPTFEINTVPFKLVYFNNNISLEYLGKSYKSVMCHAALVISDSLFDFTFSFSIFSNIFSLPCEADPETSPLKVEVQITIIDDYKAPFVGLENLGATCYINSFLQTIYFLQPFKEKLYTSTGYHTYLLQRLFYSLDLLNGSIASNDPTMNNAASNHCCRTDVLSDRVRNFIKNLTFVEHINEHQDVHEFSKFMFDVMENEDKELIKNTVQGKTVCTVKCEHGCVSKKIEVFQDLQMPIKDFYQKSPNSSLLESLEEFCMPVEIDGFNCSKHGKVKAIRQVVFDKLPNALFVVLNRFSMDWENGRYFKINERYEFPEFLDFSPFVNSDHTHNSEVDQDKKRHASTNHSYCKYRLYSVIVHSGLVDEGHFYCYLHLGDKYYKFNDESVNECSKEEAVDWNFGGLYPNSSSRERLFSAYYLVYCKEDSFNPSSVFNVEKFVPNQLVPKLANPLKPVTIKYLTPDCVSGYIGPGRFNVDDYSYTQISAKSMQCIETDNISKLFPNKLVFDRNFKSLKNTQIDENQIYYVTPANRVGVEKVAFVKIFQENLWCTYPRSMVSLGEKIINSWESLRALSPFDTFSVYVENTSDIVRVESFDQISMGDSLVITPIGSRFEEFIDRFYRYHLISVMLNDLYISIFVPRNLNEDQLLNEIQKYFHSSSIRIASEPGCPMLDHKNRVKCAISNGWIYYVGIQTQEFDINHIDHVHPFIIPTGGTVKDLIKLFKQSTFCCMSTLQSQENLQVIESHKESTNVRVLSEDTVLDPGMQFLVIQEMISDPIKLCFYSGMHEPINYPFLIENPGSIENLRKKYFFANRVFRFDGTAYVECLPDELIDKSTNDTFMIEKE